MKKLNPLENKEIKEIIDGYITYLQLQGKKDRTVKNKLWTVIPFFQHIGNKKVELITRTDVESFVIALKKRNLKSSTQNMYITNLKTFISYLNENNSKFSKKNSNEDLFKNIKLNRHERDTSEKSYITRADIVSMLPHCRSQKDRAFIFLLWDSGARVSEILNINVQDVTIIGKMSGNIKVSGKTGTRDITITSSMPDLVAWLNQYDGKGTDPLFPSRKGRLAVRTAQNILDLLVKKSGIKTEGKKVNVHSIRHGRLTELAKRKVPEMHLREFAGWTRNSEMPSVYIHPTKKDVKLSILEADGITPEEAEEVPEIEINMKPILCTFCNTYNPFNAKRCHCGAALNYDAVLEDKQRQEAHDAELIERALKAFKANEQKKIEFVREPLKDEQIDELNKPENQLLDVPVRSGLHDLEISHEDLPEEDIDIVKRSLKSVKTE